ncbi:hypothetical protein TNCV_4443721 [Trichonephila clavipes]|nr:hypothetical protein TNCV_4443721 [Trichonephila clavipes]
MVNLGPNKFRVHVGMHQGFDPKRWQWELRPSLRSHTLRRSPKRKPDAKCVKSLEPFQCPSKEIPVPYTAEGGCITCPSCK